MAKRRVLRSRKKSRGKRNRSKNTLRRKRTKRKNTLRRKSVKRTLRRKSVKRKNTLKRKKLLKKFRGGSPGEKEQEQQLAAPGRAGVVEEDDRVKIVAAAQEGNADELRKLLGGVTSEYAAQAANAADSGGGHTPAIILAAKGGYNEALRVLQEFGAHLDTEDAEGNTALHWAAIEGLTEIARITKCWSTRAKENNEGKTALDIAQKKGRRDIVERLKERDTNKDNTKIEAAVRGNLSTMKEIAESITHVSSENYFANGWGRRRKQWDGYFDNLWLWMEKRILKQDTSDKLELRLDEVLCNSIRELGETPPPPENCAEDEKPVDEKRYFLGPLKYYTVTWSKGKLPSPDAEPGAEPSDKGPSPDAEPGAEPSDKGPSPDAEPSDKGPCLTVYRRFQHFRQLRDKLFSFELLGSKNRQLYPLEKKDGPHRQKQIESFLGYLSSRAKIHPTSGEEGSKSNPDEFYVYNFLTNRNFGERSAHDREQRNTVGELERALARYFDLAVWGDTIRAERKRHSSALAAPSLDLAADSELTEAGKTEDDELLKLRHYQPPQRPPSHMQEEAKEAVAVLLGMGINPNIRNENDGEGDGWDPSILGLSARYGRSDIMEMLLMRLEPRADVDLKRDSKAHEGCGSGGDNDGRDWTPLMEAAANSHHECVKILINARADITLKNGKENTAFDVALAYSEGAQAQKVQVELAKAADGHRELAKVGGGDYENINSTELVNAVRDDSGEGVRRLLKNFHVDTKTPGDHSPVLEIAAKGGHNNALRVLVKEGAYLEAKDIDKRTALISAAAAGNLEALKVLRDAGANLDAKDISDYTALMVSVREQKADCVEYLLKEGADVNLTDHSDRSALWHAADRAVEGRGSVAGEIVQKLIQRGADVDDAIYRGERDYYSGLKEILQEHKKQVAQDRREASDTVTANLESADRSPSETLAETGAKAEPEPA